MAFRDDDLQLAKITILYDRDLKKLLPYVKVTRYDDALQYGHGYEYYAPFEFKFGVGVSAEQVIVELEHRQNGEHPPTERIHNFTGV